MQVGIVTSSQFNNLTKDDELLLNEIRKRGIKICTCVWNDSKIIWSSISLLIIRSPWYVIF